jgi:hypothetical protein
MSGLGGLREDSAWCVMPVRTGHTCGKCLRSSAILARSGWTAHFQIKFIAAADVTNAARQSAAAAPPPQLYARQPALQQREATKVRLKAGVDSRNKTCSTMAGGGDSSEIAAEFRL